jgi:hypothetical protein
MASPVPTPSAGTAQRTSPAAEAGRRPVAVRLPWAAWYGSGERGIDEHEISFPPGWTVEVQHMRGGPDIGDAGIRRALAEPLGSPPLRQLARGRRSACILVDDLSRPTPAYRLLPYVLEELSAAGLPEERVTILVALAAHRPMTREDMIRKLGPDVVRRLRVVNHCAYENLDFLGYSSRGIPIFVSRELMAAELRLAVGMITPRGAFFGGGAKLLIPGACGQATILAMHRYVRDGFREHCDEVARLAGLEFIVNALLGERLELIGLVAGDPAAAFARGVELGKELYATPVPREADVAVFSAFPKDTELLQAPLALVPMYGHRDVLRPDGTLVIASACPEGLGWHSVLGPGTQLAGRPSAPWPRTIVYSPGVNRWDVQAKFGETAVHCATWEEVSVHLRRDHGEGARVVVFPAGALQYGVRGPGAPAPATV